MKLSVCKDSMLICKNAFEQKEDYRVFHKGFELFIHDIDFFDQYIDDTNPFKIDLFSFFQSSDINMEECENIIEDIILLLREKCLRLGEKNLPQAYIDLLHWAEEHKLNEKNLANHWYYNVLPILVQKDYTQALGYDRPGFKNWLNNQESEFVKS